MLVPPPLVHSVAAKLLRYKPCTSWMSVKPPELPVNPSTNWSGRAYPERSAENKGSMLAVSPAFM